MPGDARQPRVELADSLEIRGREGGVGPCAVPRLHVAMSGAVGAAQDVSQGRPRGLVDVHEHEQRPHLTHGQSYPSRWLVLPTILAIVRRSGPRRVGCHDRSSLISSSSLSRIELPMTCRSECATSVVMGTGSTPMNSATRSSVPWGDWHRSSYRSSIHDELGKRRRMRSASTL